ncbi:hypothetical protein [Aeromonas phage ZPAH34]|uniref:hypothetical protein n=1 Tax=Aeromonas phage ZPAH34 TaxID=2924888 RepID=UPI002329905E|nr:hypothetical protein PQD16_gp157 [Aeromonas phage ZPAH34]UOX39526.1 hypothetical protein [Aeromonas phage ZPAH34]
MDTKIGRRWLVNLDHFPSSVITDENTVYIRQFYNQDRARFCYQKNRKDNHVTCFENDVTIPMEKFLEEYEKASAPEMLIKERTKFSVGNNPVQFDRFLFLDDLAIVQIEFTDELTASNFTDFPAWFEKEITHEDVQSDYELFIKINKD